SDPVLRESSRLSAAAATACQATYDILKWKDVIGEKAVERFYPSSEWPGFYGLKTVDEVKGAEGARIRADVGMLGRSSKGDAPVWLSSNMPDEEPQDKGHANHHPAHARAIKKRCDEVGVEAVLRLTGDRKPGEEGGPAMLDFLFKHLGVKAREK